MCAETSTPSPGDGAKLPALSTPLPESRGEAPLAVHQPPSRQLSEWPRDELEHLAEEFGLDPTRYGTRQDLVAALHERRQVIASMDRQAMLDVVRWGRRPVSYSAGKEQIAQEICRIRLMKFHGLSQRGLVVLGKLRGLEVNENDDIPTLVHKLKRGEGFFAKINRKRRALLGQIVSNIVGETESAAGYSYVPPPQSDGPAPPPRAEATRPASIKEEIEESGLFGGITNRIKKTADQYLNQKLDEIENRIDRKLDEIDRRLSEWRDKEVANRVRILKITLWASVIVGLFSLIYSYVSVYLKGAIH
ncbi:MAG TPA: hypothetical protein VMD30_12610 [Tepidisphaeraceae bacterium]|nr:hypothetical protein [Tepidisphaeraceae bacterium]